MRFPRIVRGGVHDARRDRFAVAVGAQLDHLQGEVEHVALAQFSLLDDRRRPGAVVVCNLDLGVYRGSQQAMPTRTLGRVLAAVVDEHDGGAGPLADHVHAHDERAHVLRGVLVAARQSAAEGVDDDQAQWDAHLLARAVYGLDKRLHVGVWIA